MSSAAQYPGYVLLSFGLTKLFISQNPSLCPQGASGLPGRNGVNGHNGLPGRDGRDGAKGEKGLSGPSGPRGFKGEAGEKGVAGSPGPRGIKGEAGPVGKVAAEQRNWKQCAWKKSDGKNIGLIKVSATMNETSKFRKREKITNFFFRVCVTGQ